MTDPDSARPEALSRVLGSYEQLESERKFAEAAYQHALQSLDQARANADRQHVFIASFVPPSLPEESLYPRRWRSLATIALIAFALWGIGGLAVQSVRDHLG
jgi:capsular polysaccharide transport system permease protein